MPLFGKRKKPNSDPKPRQPTSLTSPQPPYPTPVHHQSSQNVPPNAPIQQPYHSSSLQFPVPQSHAQMAVPSCQPGNQHPVQQLKQIYPHQKNKRGPCQDLSKTYARPCQVVNQTIDRTTEYLIRRAALCNQVASKFNDVISLMDQETFAGNEQDLQLICYQPPPSCLPQFATQPVTRGGPSKALVPARKPVPRSNQCPVTQRVLTTTNVFAKAAMYANSRLPCDLPRFKVFLPTWPLVSLAAQYSLNAYQRPEGAERDAYVDADWRTGTKAMMIKSVAMDDMKAVVFAIRGTQTLMDWTVNLNTALVSPSGFLDDPGNLCHAGFLAVARKMLNPVASRLRQLLEEDASRAACSLVITGHSAGGAVASLLFCHMLSTSMETELNILTGCFKRVHCVIFGAPPVSLLPLSKPAGQERRLKNTLFLSFINEGDPVTRAEKAYSRSLMQLYATPAPKADPPASNNKLVSTSKVNLSSSSWDKETNKRPKLPKRPATAPAATVRTNIKWNLPPAELSNAGRLVLLRTRLNGRKEDVEAYTTTDNQLRGVVFGDPLMHQMKRYCFRVEKLATRAATAAWNN